ncbi:MAG: Polysaccharide biosynthesis/export protein [Lentisphaerae bacterium ADurb.Bin242]|nr:MAG: Polysaccharide biosynthesis/export protein [Lentisphaerae bacterium ADurb.Bin242]
MAGRFSSILSAVFLLILAASCSSNVSDFPEIPDIAEIGERAPLSEEAQERQRSDLIALGKEPFPPYLINSGDIFWLKVYDHPDLDILDTVVTPDGYLVVGLIGPVKVANITISDATAKIEKQLREYIKEPKVSLFPRTINSQLATLAGKVQKSGRFPVNADMRLADLVSLGQGFPNNMDDGRQMELSDLNASLLIRNGKVLPVDFNKAMQGDPLHNLRIHGGDYIWIASRTNRLVSIMGEVYEPKYVTWYENTGILEVITSARGLKDEHSSNVIVIRGGIGNPTIYRVDLDGILSGKKPNPGLKPGDIVYVPKDGLSEYNVFIKKLLPTGQLINLIISPGSFLLGY